MLVGPGQLHTAASQLENLMHEAISTLQNYYNHSTDLQSGGGLNGAAGVTNIVTAEEVQHAQMQIQNRFGNVIQTLRSQTANYGETDHTNASQIASVASGLCH
jgi:hypothetical protein